MTLLEALKDGHVVLVTFINVKKDAQWSITFSQPSDLARFLTPMVGVLEQVPASEKKPFEFFKAIFVSEDPPQEEEDDWEDMPCGQA
jgi:hypothetical protein